MKSPHRENAKNQRSLEACKARALKRFLTEGKDNRQRFMDQFRGSTESDQRQMVRELIKSPFSSRSTGPGGRAESNVIDFVLEPPDWENDPNYNEFFIQLDEIIASELENESEDYLAQMIKAHEDDDAYYYDDSDEENQIICPVCWSEFLKLDEQQLCLCCSCGAGISITINGVVNTVDDIKARLSVMYDRHYEYCRSHKALIGYDHDEVLHYNKEGLKCEIQSGGLLALCCICGFREYVLENF